MHHYKGYKKKLYKKHDRTYKKIVFDSKLEMAYYKHLENLKVCFIYHPNSYQYMNFDCKLTGKQIKHSYTPDFIIFYKDKVEIIDAKGGFLSAEWKIKKDAILNSWNQTSNTGVKEVERYIAQVSKRVFCNNVQFKEITEDKNGNWIELTEFLKQKQQEKIDRRNIVRKLIEKHNTLIKKYAKDYKKGVLTSFESYEILVTEIKASKPWRSYMSIKNNKRYITKHKEVREAIKFWDKKIEFENKKNIKKTKEYHNKWLDKVFEISKLKVKKDET